MNFKNRKKRVENLQNYIPPAINSKTIHGHNFTRKASPIDEVKHICFDCINIVADANPIDVYLFG